MNIKNILALLAVVAIGAGSILARAPAESAAMQPAVDSESVDVVVYKSEFCGCCGGWVEHLQKTGLPVSTRRW